MNWNNIRERFAALFFGGSATGERFQTTPALRVSAAVLVLFLAVFGAWAALVPLDSAVIASGVVAVESKRKKVQHLEGGILEQIAVRDGDHVKAGQVLAVLNQTDTAAALGVLMSEHDAVLALETRLLAETGETQDLEFPTDLVARREIASAKAAIKGQTNLFEKRRRSLEGQIAILDNRRSQHLNIVDGLEAQLSAVGGQSELIAQEEAATDTLYKKGLSTLPRVLALKRTRLSLSGQRGELKASIAQNKLRVSEIDMEILNLQNERSDKAAVDLRDAQKRRFELADRIKAARGQLNRTSITAPADGIIVASTIHTAGQVIRGGDTLMEIVPQNDNLIIEAQLKPDDADNVKPGIAANVRLIPFKTKFQPVVEGKVRSVSADRLIDPQTGAAFYQAEIEVERAVVAAALGNDTLQPGLPAEVMIGLGSHTAFEYLVAPLNRRLQHAMREE
jgi:HlyD family type I secretion membrane fusion protein